MLLSRKEPLGRRGGVKVEVEGGLAVLVVVVNVIQNFQVCKFEKHSVPERKTF